VENEISNSTNGVQEFADDKVSYSQFGQQAITLNAQLKLQLSK
jgi:hypothetical protein